MNAGRYYKISHFIPWTITKIGEMLVISSVPTLLYYFFGWKWLAIPWVPVALVGTAAAFIAGFRNTQTYARVWEARQIYGGIVNLSRTWGVMIRDSVRSADPEQERAIHRELFYRHFAWMTALRFQLREPKYWENVQSRSYYGRYLKKYYQVPEWNSDLQTELQTYLAPGELAEIIGRKNRATQLLSLQSKTLRSLNENGLLSDLNFVECEQLIKDLYDQQGRCERIKNFPYPRQFASISWFFVHILAVLLPMGFLQEFSKLGPNMCWLTIPFSTLVGWMFMTLEQIGESTENPFEGNANDVPIASISRTIEIDMREMLDETELPSPIPVMNQIMM